MNQNEVGQEEILQRVSGGFEDVKTSASSPLSSMEFSSLCRKIRPPLGSLSAMIEANGCNGMNLNFCNRQDSVSVFVVLASVLK